MLDNFYNVLLKSREQISRSFKLFSNQKLSTKQLEDLEEKLIETDMGYDTVQDILSLFQNSFEDKLSGDIRSYLVKSLSVDFNFKNKNNQTVILIVGVNGSGKTTSLAKIANYYKKKGKAITIIAADTYRAAAVEQLQIWSEKIGCKIVYNKNSKEPSSVLFNGLDSAKTNKSDIILVDTAGRLHTHGNLMLELEKMQNIICKRFPEFDHYSLITIDASLGQNSLIQAKEFKKYCNLKGVILTKLDGTAKGGIIFPLYKKLNIPVRFIGIGEKLSDIATFDPELYVDGLLGTKTGKI
tara:strand:+ start:409 stop:1299 length:891 start_codon:yes stop_codon:yes gene_type:complete